MALLYPENILKIFEKPNEEISVENVLVAGYDGGLTDGQVEGLASLIPSNTMETIAEGGMNVSFENIIDLKDNHRNDARSFNRQIIMQWKQEHPRTNQMQVFMFVLVSC